MAETANTIILSTVRKKYDEMLWLRRHYGHRMSDGGPNEFDTKEDYPGWLARLPLLHLFPSTDEPLDFSVFSSRGQIIPFRSNSSPFYEENFNESPFAIPFGAARNDNGSIEVGIGFKLMKAKRQLIFDLDAELYKKQFFWHYPKPEHLGSIALILCADDEHPILKTRIAPPGFSIFGEDSAIIGHRTKIASSEETEAVLEGFRSAYWNSVNEPA